MSSTTKAKRPGELDRYYTPDDVARACFITVAPYIQHDATVLEPSIGGGAFARAIRGKLTNAYIIGVDKDPDAPGMDGCADEVYCADFVGWGPPHPTDWIIGNPPYNEAEEHVRWALGCAREGVAMLLRLAFLETSKRAALWSEHPPSDVHVLVQRPSFTGGGTDSAAYGWFVWIKSDPSRETHLHWLDWRGGHAR